MSEKPNECPMCGGTGGWPGLGEWVLCKPCNGSGKVGGTKVNESRRKLANGATLTVSGEGVQPTDAVLAEVLCEMAAAGGAQLEFSEDEIAQRLLAKGVDPKTMEWLD